ncbi:MAG: PAS domain-containing protein [Elusimicrobia bacterium]|nr:PAS domain-containing protein [Elusimicrobiota bacterium]
MSAASGRFAPRLALAVGALLAVAIGGLGLAFSSDLERELTDDLVRSLSAQARLAALSAPLEARALSAACACRASMIAPDGRLTADSELDAAGLAKAENHATRPEVAAAIAGREESAVRHSATIGVDFLYAAVPLPKSRGVLRLSLPLTQVAARAARARSFVLWAALAAFVLALAAAWALARSAGRPLEEMAAVARRLAAGDYAARVRGVFGNDERALLGETMNSLAERVEAVVGELSRDKGRLASVLNQMEEGVVAVGPGGEVLLINPALSRLLGLDPVAARGRGYIESLRHRGLADLVGEALRGRRVETREVRLFAPEELIFEAHAAPLTQQGRAAGALVVLHDITRLRRLEQMRRDFVANVSHELRTPLASIKGYAETLREGAIDDKQNRMDFVGTIETQATHLSKLVDDLLDLSSIESGHRLPKLVSGPLRPLLEAAARDAAPIASDRRVRVNPRPPEDLPAALFDADQIRQVLANLVSNAVKYSEPGGLVELSATVVDGEIVVSVRDEGVGIPDADLPRVFERFYRVDKSRAREAGGTGLGLAIVKHLVEAHGGRVWVASRQPGGSTFFFSLHAA